MTFDELLAEIARLLQRERRLSYRGLKRRFELEDDLLEDLKEELIGAKRIARDEDGRFLVHSIDTSRTSAVPDAERRQLTVMFCDLVGSTALSTRLDPEELRDVVRGYQETCAESIRRYDGHVTQHLGDGLLVYFGFPNAHEDDPQRAVLAALEIVTSVSARCFASLPEGNLPLKVRVGIHTGLVVIGDIGGSDKHEMLALGETPNLAARLQSAAKPNTVVISEATERLVQGVFECRTLAVQRLKGVSAPVRVFRVIRTNHAAPPKGLVPLVGRVAEIDKLHAAWIRAQRGIGECVFLSGEPGIGKSRLLRELREAVGSETTIRIELRCSAYHQNSALYPIIDHLQRVLEFRRDQSPQSQFVKLAQRLSPYRFPRSETLALLADLLSLPLPSGYPSRHYVPKSRRATLWKRWSTGSARTRSDCQFF